MSGPALSLEPDRAADEPRPPNVDFAQLPRERLEVMLAAGEEIRECYPLALMEKLEPGFSQETGD